MTEGECQWACSRQRDGEGLSPGELPRRRPEGSPGGLGTAAGTRARTRARNTRLQVWLYRSLAVTALVSLSLGFFFCKIGTVHFTGQFPEMMSDKVSAAAIRGSGRSRSEDFEGSAAVLGSGTLRGSPPPLFSTTGSSRWGRCCRAPGLSSSLCQLTQEPCRGSGLHFPSFISINAIKRTNAWIP